MTEPLEALGRHGLSLSWQLATLVAVAWVVCTLLGKGFATGRYRLWLLILGRLCLPVVLVTPIGLLPEITPSAATLSVTGPSPASTLSGEPESPAPVEESASAPAPHRSIPELLFLGWGLIWLGGATALALDTVRRQRGLRREIDAAAPPAAELAGYVERKRRELGLPKPVTVRVMPENASVVGPALVGLARPVVVVPRSFDDRWWETLHGPLVLHELIHLARRDHWINLPVAAVRIAYFFHPAVWIATSLLLRERERLCDDAVVRHYDASVGPYLRALCRYALDLPLRRPERLGIPLVRGRSDLTRRIQRLATPGSGSASRISVAGLLLAGGLALAMAAGRAGAGGPVEPPAETLDDASPEVQRLAEDLERAFADPDGRPRGTRIALRLVEDHPTMPAAVASMTVMALEPPGPTARGRSVWRAHVEAHPGDPAILRNAAIFFRGTNSPGTEALLERGRTLDPANPWWPTQLGAIRKRSGRLEEARADFATALELDPEPVERVLLLGNAARVALDTGRLDEAQALTERQLAGVPEIEGAWLHGNALHTGRLTLGELALLRDDPDEAATWLVAAADVPSSPQLMSFGPNTLLAEKLLQRGFTEPVLRYLEACADFWEHDRGRLDAWAADIRAGRMPDFGAGRKYHF